MWKGTIAFGLVAVPVRLYAATENQNLAFHQVHVEDGSRVRHRRFCAAEDKEIPFDEIGKGYETADGQVVVLTDEDLADLPLPSAHTIEVLAFVPIESVDPIYFDRSYFLEPEKSAVKPFVMLRDAMNKSGQVAVTKIAIRQRESLALLRVHRDVIMVDTMLWPDEVRSPEFDFLAADPPQVSVKEMKMAAQLIDALSEPVFDPGEYHDDYRKALKELVEAKIEGHETVEPPAATQAPDADVTSLLEALSSSIEASRSSGGSKRTTGKRTTEEKSSSRATSSGEEKASSPKRRTTKSSSRTGGTGGRRRARSQG
ncbi:non-homologous end joining protein Ku [Rhodococcus sp. NPDC004095]